MSVSESSVAWVEERFQQSIVPTLMRYIEIPNKSPSFDPGWRAAGHMDRAVELLASGRAARCPKAPRSKSCAWASARR